MAERVALIDYGAGNLRSASNALREAARRADLDVSVEITADPDAVARADRIVLPGVGAFGACAAGLRAADGLIEAMDARARGQGRPFLGVCVGMQLLATVGREHGEHAGLDWIPGVVDLLPVRAAGLKIPHMGWSPLARPHVAAETATAALVTADLDGAYVYFVHSYALTPDDPADVALWADYGARFPAAVLRDTVLGVQFHPEKSQVVGLGLLARWLAWRP